MSNKVMRVCFFSHGSGTNQDGATLSMLNVMEELASRGHFVIGIMAKDVNLEYLKIRKNIKFYFLHAYKLRNKPSLPLVALHFQPFLHKEQVLSSCMPSGIHS